MRSRTGIRRENRHLRNTGNANLIPDNKKYAQPKQLIAYYAMSLEEFVKKTRCSVHSASVGYYANQQHQERTYYMYVNDESQVVYVKDGNIPKYKKSFQSRDSQTTKKLAWEYIKSERIVWLNSRNEYNYFLLKEIFENLDDFPIHIFKYEEYSQWSRQIAKNFTRDEIKKEIDKFEGRRKGYKSAKLNALDKYGTMRHAMSGVNLRGNYEALNAHENALEIHTIYPNQSKQ